MKIDISYLVLQGKILDEILNYIKFDLTEDDEIIPHSANPFETKFEYDNGVERIIPLVDLAAIDKNLFLLCDYYEIFSSTQFITSRSTNELDYYKEIISITKELSKYEIVMYNGFDRVAFIQVDYNCPQHSYIELY